MTKQNRVIHGVIFDFSGTVFRLEKDHRWLEKLTDNTGQPLDSALKAELSEKTASLSGDDVELTDEYRYAWENRDLDPGLHRKIYLELIRQAGVSQQKYAEACYARLPDMRQWTPYPDAKEAMETTKKQGCGIAVISNIPFDIRPAFRAHGLDEYVDEYVLSFEVGLLKPTPAIFQPALDKLGIVPDQALMIGDNPNDDGGAMELGCAFELVAPVPTTERPDALLNALRAYGIGESRP